MKNAKKEPSVTICITETGLKNPKVMVAVKALHRAISGAMILPEALADLR